VPSSQRSCSIKFIVVKILFFLRSQVCVHWQALTIPHSFIPSPANLFRFFQVTFFRKLPQNGELAIVAILLVADSWLNSAPFAKFVSHVLLAIIAMRYTSEQDRSDTRRETKTETTEYG
jgi:hypothetical protein